MYQNLIVGTVINCPIDMRHINEMTADAGTVAVF